jgi:hypothetical protein
MERGDALMVDKIQFRPGLLEEQLEKRIGRDPMLSIDLTAKRDLTRYYQVLADSMPRLQFGEACWIVDILNSTILDERTYRYLYVDIEDSIQDGFDEQWKIDGRAFAAKVRDWPPCASMAVVDAAERFWAIEDHDQGMQIMLEAAGFRI